MPAEKYNAGELPSDSQLRLCQQGFKRTFYLLHEQGFEPGLFQFDFDDDLNRENAGLTQLELEARLCALLAGEAATYIETGKRDSVGSGCDSWEGDFAVCMGFIERIFLVNDDPKSAGNLAADHYLEALFWRTVCLLNNPIHKQQITVIAQALIEKRTLSAGQCQQVLRAAMQRLDKELMEQRGISTPK